MQWLGKNAAGYDPETQNVWATLPMKKGDIKAQENEFAGKAPKSMSKSCGTLGTCPPGETSRPQNVAHNHDTIREQSSHTPHTFMSTLQTAAALPLNQLHPFLRPFEFLLALASLLNITKKHGSYFRTVF
jgi:hypothetical protein